MKNVIKLVKRFSVSEETILSFLYQNETSVRRVLAEFLNQLYPNGKFRSYTLARFGKIDLFAAFPAFVYIIEIELKREDPVNNVGKIYRYLEENGGEFEGKKLIFLHAFSSHYDKGGALTKRKNAEFIGNKMSQEYNNVAYISVKFDSIESLKNRVINAIKVKG